MITVFGSINLDLVVALPRLPTAGETVSGRDHQTFPGGKGANQALAARRAGATVRMVGAVGQDGFAELALENLRESGVDLSRMHVLNGSTGLAFIGVDPSGENQIIVASGTNQRVEAQWLEGCFSSGDTLMVQGEVPFPQVVQAAGLARDADASVFWNPAPVAEGDFRACFEAAGTVVVNTSEAATIANGLGIAGDPVAFAEQLATPKRSVIVTLGADGVVARSGTAGYRFQSPKIEAVDSTGAGDAFCGAVAAALDRQVPFERALKEGVAAGALACTVTGAQSSAPHREDIARLADQIV
ncbi:ribokinase [Roseibium sediminicola]|uniref:Ribokinase n=1 Tax=Roseibium sediminicola TaxID=2933272 RepID=A0ABT0GZ12_9HYPH|nr:ribokinase [Roseibium sp. CAU 1639]MCK7614080.1 ribokinase [Roseibium sp. CAU 1639]